MTPQHAEQLVYGSFPFRGQGYDLLARSPGCNPTLVAEVVAACRRYGQPPSGDASRPAHFALALPSRSWAVVAVSPQGTDDQGRPGALAFHAVIVPAEVMVATGWNVFGFAPRFQEWTADTPADLPTLWPWIGRIAIPPAPADDARVGPIVAAITRGRRVAIEADAPIDELVRLVWAALPERVRRRASVADWAFGGENRFDLVAFPRLAGVALDPSYLGPEALMAPAPPRSRLGLPALLRRRDRGEPVRAVHAPGSVALGLGGVVVVGLAALVWAAGLRQRGRLVPPEAAPGATAEAEDGSGADPTAHVADRLGPADEARARRGLRDLADRFAGFDPGDPADSTAFLARVADVLHYHGPILTPAEVARLTRSAPGSPDADRALRLHDLIQRFRDDRPWPGRFADLSLAEQLRALGRSFHLDPGTPPAAIPAELIARLARPGLVVAGPLAAELPTLTSYARFLAKVPRLDDPPEPPRSGR